ncbi:MBL fold metallo-hydrolase [Sphingomonas sp. A2-49]|nr:MBL fold metallo-hydrolase [Sphingomonas sp. A2-49]
MFIEVAHERAAILLDCGDLSALSARDLLRVRAVCVSHMHIDHLIGFDALLRVNVGRDAVIDLIGPVGVTGCIGAKLAGYSWDLVDRYATELVFVVHEVIAAGRVAATRFRFSRGFAPEPERERSGEAILATTHWRLRTAVLAHHGPCLGFLVEEPIHINIWRNRVEAAGLAIGPWLKPLKEAVRAGSPDDTLIALPDGGTAPLAELRALVSVERGQKIGYATDVADTPANRAAIVGLCRDADLLFIEASFSAADAERAAARAHLTTTAAGEIARACGARRVEPFHFSPRYDGGEQMLLDEVSAAFAN